MPDKDPIKGKVAAAAMMKRKSLSSSDKNTRAVEKILLEGYWNKEIPLDKKSVKDMIQVAAKQAGVKPETLYASAYQEGLRNAEYIGSNQMTHEEESPDSSYPVNGFFQMGVDTFGDAAERVRAKGYIPKDFDFQPFKAVNEKKQAVNSGLFKNVQDGLIAKAAMMRDLQDQVVEYAKKKGLKVDGDELDYLTMSGFNGGFGRSKQMVDEIADKHRGDVKGYVQGGKTSLGKIHKNVAPRMRYMDIMREVFKEDERKAQVQRMQAPPQMFGEPLNSPYDHTFKGGVVNAPVLAMVMPKK